jgi:hypothetical protein
MELLEEYVERAGHIVPYRLVCLVGDMLLRIESSIPRPSTMLTTICYAAVSQCSGIISPPLRRLRINASTIYVSPRPPNNYN